MRETRNAAYKNSYLPRGLRDLQGPTQNQNYRTSPRPGPNYRTADEWTPRTRNADSMTAPTVHDFAEGDRVAAIARPGFPLGTVIKLMDLGYLLVQWDGNVLETAHYRELVKADAGL